MHRTKFPVIDLMQPPEEKHYSVSQINLHLRRLMDSIPALQDVWIEGEVSNFKRHDSGHVYFSLKDSQSQIKGVMWRSDAIRQRALPQNGERVQAHGKISVYEPRGEYQLYCDRFIALDQTGDLHAQFLALWEQLEAEGIFSSEIKRPLPSLPRRIGIVTSPTGAALQDVLQVLQRRYPLGEVILSPTPVQGETAPPQIVEALQRVDAVGVDVILLVRGGGSIEDLWCFNDPQIAYAIRGTHAPVVTGVGHEIDTTLVDGAADVRAPTPSAAAEIATPDVATIRAGLRTVYEQLGAAAQTALTSRRESLADSVHKLRLLSPASDIRTLRQRLDDQRSRLTRTATQGILRRRTLLEGRVRALELSNPLHLLARGYAIVSYQGKRLSRADQVTAGTDLEIKLSMGRVNATVKEILTDES